MGVRRKSRARLAAVEKRGQIIASGVSPVMAKTLISADQHRVGQMVITDLVYDFGSSKTTISTSPTAEVPLGIAPANANEDSYLCKLDHSIFGVVTSIETIALEPITDGTLTDYDIRKGTAGDGYLGVAPTGDAALALPDSGTNITAAVGKHMTSAYDLNTDTADDFLYLVTGAATGQRASCVITVTDVSDVATIVTGITTMRLRNAADSANIDFVADSSVNWDAGSPTANKIGIGNTMNNKFKLTQAISVALHTHGSGNVFDTDLASRSAGGGTSVSTITVTRSAAVAPNANENTTNVIRDGIAASGLSMTDFSGGIGTGQALTGGKILLRITGHLTPDDL